MRPALVLALHVALPAALAALAACGDNAKEPDYLAYDWDDRRVLCSDAIDDLAKPINFGFIDRQLDLAGQHGWVLVLHAHEPTVTVSLDALQHVLDRATRDGLQFYTFRELVPETTPHAGLALAFDDNSPDQWLLARDMLAAHHAHVTYFVARWNELTPAQHDEIAVLRADGHDIEPHTMTHPNAIEYVKQHGIDAYMNDEVLPSFQALIDAGYPAPAAFAYPFGAHTPEIDAAVLQHVDLVRTTPGECPWAGWGS